MKKIMVIAASMFLASCGGSSEKPVSTDSVVISADSVAVADSSVSATQGGGATHELPIK